MTVSSKILPATSPEEVSLEKNPRIDSVSMSLNVISCTSGITSSLRDSIDCPDGFSEEAAKMLLNSSCSFVMMSKRRLRSTLDTWTTALRYKTKH